MVKILNSAHAHELHEDDGDDKKRAIASSYFNVNRQTAFNQENPVVIYF